MSQKKLTVAMIGAGNILSSHLIALNSLPRLQLSSLCGLNPDIASRAAELGVHACADYRDAIARRPDIVVVNVPHDLHYPIAKAALEAGAHVLVEKPMALTMLHINDLLATAAVRGAALIVSDTAYCSAQFLAARKIVQEGHLGRFFSGHYVNHRHYFTADRPQWFYDSDCSGGGQFINIGVHRVAAVRAILGDDLQEKSVMASVHRTSNCPTTESATMAMVSYEAGQAVVYEEYGYLVPPHGPVWSIRFMFERGMLCLEQSRIWTSDVNGQVTEHPFSEHSIGGYVPLYQEFLKAIDGERHYPTALHGARDVRIALAAYASSRDGRLINLLEEQWLMSRDGREPGKANGERVSELATSYQLADPARTA